MSKTRSFPPKHQQGIPIDIKHLGTTVTTRGHGRTAHREIPAGRTVTASRHAPGNRQQGNRGGDGRS